MVVLFVCFLKNDENRCKKVSFYSVLANGTQIEKVKVDFHIYGALAKDPP